VIKKIAGTFGTRFATAFINFLVVVAVSRLLGAEGKGEQGIIIATIALILLFSNIIGGASLVFLAPRYRAGQLLLPSYIWSVVVGLVWFVVMWISGIVPQEWAPHLAVLAVINSWASVNCNLLVGRERIGRSNLVNLFQSLSVIIVFPLMVIIAGHRNINSYIIALYTSYLVMFLLSLLFSLPHLKDHRNIASAPYSRIFRDLFFFGFMNQLAHIAQLMSFRLSYYLLEGFTGMKSVGVYSNGVSLSEAVWMISGSIALVQYSRIANTDDRDWARQITARLTRYGLWASLIVIIPMVLLPSSFWVFLFGKGFEEVNQVMWSLAPGILVFNYALIIGHYFSGTGRYYVNAIASAAGLLVTLGLALWLIPLYSFHGAAITASISYLVTSLVVLIWFVKESGISPGKIIPLWSDIKDMNQMLREALSSLKKER
jgi:O-antigen/teichoic acid export membrane protein